MSQIKSTKTIFEVEIDGSDYAPTHHSLYYIDSSDEGDVDYDDAAKWRGFVRLMRSEIRKKYENAKVTVPCHCMPFGWRKDKSRDYLITVSIPGYLPGSNKKKAEKVILDAAKRVEERIQLEYEEMEEEAGEFIESFKFREVAKDKPEGKLQEQVHAIVSNAEKRAWEADCLWSQHFLMSILKGHYAVWDALLKGGEKKAKEVLRRVSRPARPYYWKNCPTHYLDDSFYRFILYFPKHLMNK
jgi:hypothetical protein